MRPRQPTDGNTRTGLATERNMVKRSGGFKRWLAASGALLMAAITSPAALSAPSFVAFESGHVRPLALSADGSKLFAVNTPNNTLVIYNITAYGINKQAEVSV